MTAYFDELHARIAGHGGMFNAHLHLDRAGTYHATLTLLKDDGVGDGSILSLAGKHGIIPRVHASDCYDPDRLYARVDPYVEQMIACGTTRADTVVDTTTDRVGLGALETFARLKARHAGRIDLRLGAYSPLGFRDDDPARWSLLERGAEMADFIGLLPERDDHALYPAHIGFAESCRRGIALAYRLGKKIHIHVDQANHRHEGAAETVCAVLRCMNLAVPEDEPRIWLIHLISPSTYDEARFAALVADMAALNIGVICCPAAAISMRQLRPLSSPTGNSIARVLDLVAGGVQVRLGSDNVCDITSPMGTVDMIEEVQLLGNAMRYYDIDFLARIAAGKLIDAGGMDRLRQHLTADAAFVAEAVRGFDVAGR